MIWDFGRTAGMILALLKNSKLEWVDLPSESYIQGKAEFPS